MTQDQIAAAANGYVDAMQQVAESIAPSFDADAIHRFRVETKRLRALLRLLQTADEGLDVKLGKRFRELYAALGEIRDAQMQLIRIVKDEGPALPGYALWLASRIGEGQRRWVETYSDKVLRKLAAHIAGTVWPETLEPETLTRFVAAHLDAIGDMLGKTTLHDEDLHDIRKKVKDLQHILRWAQAEWPEAVAALGGKNLAAIEDIAQRAGDYNDERNAIATLEDFMREAAGEKEREKAQAVRDRWAAARDENRRALLRDIDAFRTAGEAANVHTSAG